MTGGVQGAFADQIQCGNETAYEDSFCANVLRLDAPLVISDAATDDRVATVPAVTDGMVGSYAGAPIRLPDVGIVAVLCVFDDHAREWSATEVADLTGLATEMADELQHYR
ncbi:MAG: GAF domain-containing protein [Actinobacteria bacterium]|nr:GAF domain-containing protein [Actinomycetota bacterium]